MELLFAVVIGVLYAAGVFMLLRRSLVKLILGLALLGYASNLLLFSISPLVEGAPPVIPESAKTLVPPFADPLPQALILTAIVIGFGTQAFAIVLFKRAYQTVGSDDVDELSLTEKN